MPRLFVAIDLPSDVKAELSRLIPAGDGWRSAKPDQLHLTLHFLGECELPAVVKALQPVRFAPFAMMLEGVGDFRQRGGNTILWAGVLATPELHRLHTELATALQAIGYQPESRPYTPHITLARGGPGASRSDIAEFLRRHADWQTREFPVTEFRLMSSTLNAAGSIYRCEQAFPLRNDV